MYVLTLEVCGDAPFDISQHICNCHSCTFSLRTITRSLLQYIICLLPSADFLTSFFFFALFLQLFMWVSPNLLCLYSCCTRRLRRKSFVYELLCKKLWWCCWFFDWKNIANFSLGNKLFFVTGIRSFRWKFPWLTSCRVFVIMLCGWKFYY
jgi:hypothetical protein